NACVSCTNTCPNVGATQCSGAQVQTCTADANGCLSLAAPATCPSGQTCVSGQNRCLSTGEVACASAPVISTGSVTATDPGASPACLRPVAPSALPAGQVNHIGVKTVGNVVPFDIPTNTGGFSIVSQAVNAQTGDVTFSFSGQNVTVPNSVVPLIVKDPSGATFYDDNAPLPDDISTALAVYDDLSPSTGATAEVSPGFTRMISTLQTIYSRAGLCLGNVTLYDVPTWAKARFATGVSADKTGPCDELDQMFTLSLPGNALNFFFVDDITQPASGGGVGSVVGID